MDKADEILVALESVYGECCADCGTVTLEPMAAASGPVCLPCWTVRAEALRNE